MSALPQKADISRAFAMSAKCQKRTFVYVERLFRVVKNDADRVPHTAADAADAVPEIDAISAFRSLNRPIVYGEGHRITLPQWHYFGAALHTWSLFSQHKFSAGEVAFGFGEEDCNLEREREVAVEILMQAVEVTWHILQQQRRRPRLTFVVAPF